MISFDIDLLQEVRKIFLGCDEFDSGTALRTLFVTRELIPFRDRLPGTNNKAARVDLTIQFLLSQNLTNGTPIIFPFILVLRERYPDGVQLRQKIEAVYAKMQQSQGSEFAKGGQIVIDYLLITALEEERDSILNKLAWRQIPPSPEDVRVYFVAELPITYSDGTVTTSHLVLISLLGMGRVQATVSTADAIRRWHPRKVVMVGIAGGIAARHVNLGDVLVSEQIVDYELQKLTSAGTDVRWKVHSVDARLLEAARNFTNLRWQELLMVDRPDSNIPKRHIGPIASGDKVIAAKVVLDFLRDKWPALIGVEMEGAGVATASFQASEPPGFFMVRGVSDLADESKDKPDTHDWRAYACDIAASYTIALLRAGPVPAAK